MVKVIYQKYDIQSYANLKLGDTFTIRPDDQYDSENEYTRDSVYIVSDMPNPEKDCIVPYAVDLANGSVLDIKNDTKVIKVECELFVK